jgi:hypothetical protein
MGFSIEILVQGRAVIDDVAVDDGSIFSAHQKGAISALM